MTSEAAPIRGWADALPFARRHILVVWTLWGLACLIFMLNMPGRETIPYHLGWAGFALAFGLGTWSRNQLVAALGWYTLATGGALLRSWSLGNVGWEETNEIPLMFMLAMLMVWHVRRRQAALNDVTVLAEREVQACLDREQLMRLTSHELRTPLTIARGYIELLQARSPELENQQDLAVVGDELERISRVSDRLIRMIRLQDDTTLEMVDIDLVMTQTVERWQVVAERQWLLDARAGWVVGSPERLRTGLDTLVENAIRYTAEGDTIQLVGSRYPDHVVLGVFDTGIGLSPGQIAAINASEQLPSSALTSGTVAPAEPDPVVVQRMNAEDRLAGTGLGLSIVRALAHARGGTLRASQAPGGGASMVLTFPLDAPASPSVHVPRTEAGAAPPSSMLTPEWPNATVVAMPGVAES